QVAAMGAMHALVAGVVHTHLIFFAGGVAKRLKKSDRIQKTMRWVTGIIFLGFGARLAVANQ
ncbi:MAG: hypothetical protein GWO23_10720, partial [Gammaproteobacteria bacterium]|nr:hypothetical protein [Gammaproteobacteria bacterium]